MSCLSFGSQLSQFGRYQFQSPSSFIVAGSSTARMMVASIRMAAASPTPSIWKLISLSEQQYECEPEHEREHVRGVRFHRVVDVERRPGHARGVDGGDPISLPAKRATSRLRVSREWRSVRSGSVAASRTQLTAVVVLPSTSAQAQVRSEDPLAFLLVAARALTVPCTVVQDALIVFFFDWRQT